MIEIWTPQTQIHDIHLVLDGPLDRTNEPVPGRAQRVSKQFQDVIVRVRRSFLNRGSHRSPVSENVLIRRIRFFRIEDHAMNWSEDVRVTGIDPGVDDGNLEAITDHAGTAHSATRIPL